MGASSCFGAEHQTPSAAQEAFNPRCKFHSGERRCQLAQEGQHLRPVIHQIVKVIDVFEAIGNMDADKQVAVLKTLFGQWAIQGAAKLTGNLGQFTDALAMVNDPSRTPLPACPGRTALAARYSPDSQGISGLLAWRFPEPPPLRVLPG